LGVRRGFRADEFYYKETSTELLWRAISRKGPGAKEFRVTFPDRSKQLIHCTPGREYADIMGPGLLAQYERAIALVRPGMRVLDIVCGTGYGAAWLCGRVGSSGAVVAIDPDAESITYAQKRYPTKNVAFEVGNEASLAGETDGSFDSVFSLRKLATDRDEDAVLREIWRVTSPGGFLFVGRETSTEQGSVLSRAEFHSGLVRTCVGASGAAPGIVEFMTTPGTDFQVALVRKPEA
jgi:2-polyprenyl-3-methyl-5-hydroxy-6-metoxy-1,4-benzoquinol methylase